ncbi:hypothetical protein RHMOL_Rhmol12G0080100 [Rhododendron molle]|uniref:Uncharacterized protein n=1 Tax=Rhododendron molle TaxID=49168 RepID=A0ACC0LFI7_RHOML|nr:hypothetical protein RHMOL_Rhmol12G0080100 [Rhododendron molle]
MGIACFLPGVAAEFVGGTTVTSEAPLKTVPCGVFQKRIYGFWDKRRQERKLDWTQTDENVGWWLWLVNGGGGGGGGRQWWRQIPVGEKAIEREQGSKDDTLPTIQLQQASPKMSEPRGGLSYYSAFDCNVSCLPLSSGQYGNYTE